ncbi:ATP-binding cassette domain-containing protein [Mesomycoplasma lagogenitalium]|uniref:ATP-binding cassette domain-containing protein n=1 Tax=Mesomycoplasma lagogenitalium TaxID=171286 RepID=A0ABY8LX45_9BACT|nr:ATP-binding cassette domain-containing protein [Mesomycoplasma lagogenitalium]WGI36836.1 ATP-binding cassette domain-containing protein [Mesomycoplasma lagogenitalium]
MNKNSEKTILNVKNLKKYFYSKKGIVQAVDKVNFKLYEGEVLGLIGESGSGKTTVGRSLIRLYDNYNGQVSLLDKIISGKKVSKSKNRFMRKNMQMIFQDPHASLNGQKNVYSILKEPLKVNNIIKDKMKDTFSDFSTIIKNFHYSFLRKYKEQKLMNQFSIINEANEYFKEWETHFDDFQDFDLMFENNSYEDIFNSYFSYLNKRQFHESKAINEIYQGASTLYNYYFEKQQEYRDGNLSFDELALRESERGLKEAELLTKNSRANVALKKQIAELESKLKEFLELSKEKHINSQNYVKSYIFEYKSEELLNKNEALKTEDFKNYSFFMKRRYVNKITKQFLKNKSNKLSLSENVFYWLTLEEIDQMINEFNEFNKFIIEKYENKFVKIANDNNESWKNKKQMYEELLAEYAEMDLSKYIEIAHSRKEKYQEQKTTLENEIKNLKSQISRKKEILKIDEMKLNLAKLIHQKNEHVFQHELDKYISEFKKWEIDIDEKIENGNILIQEISARQLILDQKFKEVHLNFLKWYEQKLTADGLNKKQVKKELKIYEQKVSEKEEILKSFKLETKILNKIYYQIMFLLGLHKKTRIFKAKKKVKKVMYDQAIYNALEEVGLLKQFAYRYPHEFSGGQRQRIVIARALISQPKIIIADEPIASLDISIQAQIVNLLKSLIDKKGIGMIFIAHDLSMVEYIADNIIIMHLGKIVERGKTHEIYSNPKHPYTINLFKSIPKMSNANEPFEASSFELNYLSEQKFPNQVIEKLVGDSQSHKVYGTEKQLEQWLENEK